MKFILEIIGAMTITVSFVMLIFWLTEKYPMIKTTKQIKEDGIKYRKKKSDSCSKEIRKLSRIIMMKRFLNKIK